MAESGALSIAALLDKAKLKFVGHLETMDHSRLVSKLYRHPLQCNAGRDPWRSRVQALLGLYDLQSSLVLLQDGTLSYEEWCSKVTSKVLQHHCSKLKKRLAEAVKCSHLLETNPTLGTDAAAYLSLPGKLSSFYFKLRAGSLRLEIESGRFCKVARKDRTCRLCRGPEVEDAGHFMLHCPALQLERDALFADMMPFLSETELECGSGDVDAMVLTLLGKPVKEVEDQSAFTAVIVNRLHDMWKRRCTLLHSHLPTPSPSNTVVHPDGNVPVPSDPLPRLHAHYDVRQPSN